ncbi:MAG: hypothetical protein BZY87_04430 [SAR202 cluster bacterium Io17-Chloro-G6]|nr:MAG: hypothetical protein BZY87_04430 [SAR202 cluster bacterium Io17-Chloro-G6]
MSHFMKIAFWATVAGQIILLAAFIAVKENTLRTGTSVLLQTVPVDPLSLLQGEFVVLRYEIGEMPDWARNASRGETFYVFLREDSDGVWRERGYQRGKPKSGEVFIKGRVDSPGRLEFGIDTFFIPEGTGHIIERSRDVKVRVAIGSGGTAVIEDLLVDGKPFDPNRPVAPAIPPRDPPRPPEPVRPAEVAPPPRR